MVHKKKALTRYVILSTCSPNYLASIILRRNHFKVLYSESPVGRQRSNNAGSRIKDALTQQFGDENVKLDMANQRGELSDFPIVYNDDSILSSYSASNNLRDIPIINQCRVYVKREKYSPAFQYLRQEKERILSDDHGSLV